MNDYDPLDHTMLNLMEVYRRQVTDLKTNLINEQEEREALRSDIGWKDSRIEDLERHVRQRENDNNNLRDTITERDTKITKLEDIIQSLKIELQDARAATTAAKGGGEETS